MALGALSRLRDPSGRAVLHSGDLDPNGDLRDEHSHYVKRGELSHDKNLLLLQTRFVALTHKGTERPVIIQVNRHLMPLSIVRPATGISASFGHPLDMRVAKASIPPLARAGQDYHVRLPDCPGEYSLQVKLNFRYLAPHLLDELGAAPLKHLLETVVIDEHESVIHVTSRK